MWIFTFCTHIFILKCSHLFIFTIEIIRLFLSSTIILFQFFYRYYFSNLAFFHSDLIKKKQESIYLSHNFSLCIDKFLRFTLKLKVYKCSEYFGSFASMKRLAQILEQVLISTGLLSGGNNFRFNLMPYSWTLSYWSYSIWIIASKVQFSAVYSLFEIFVLTTS